MICGIENILRNIPHIQLEWWNILQNIVGSQNMIENRTFPDVVMGRSTSAYVVGSSTKCILGASNNVCYCMWYVYRRFIAGPTLNNF